MNKILIALGIVVTVGTVWIWGQEEPGALQYFMRRKLEHSQGILEGVVLADYESVKKHADKLLLVSHDEGWNIIQTSEYAARSSEFRRLLRRLAETAEAKKIDAAALTYLQMTAQCFDCHQYLRRQNPALLPR